MNISDLYSKIRRKISPPTVEPPDTKNLGMYAAIAAGIVAFIGAIIFAGRRVQREPLAPTQLDGEGWRHVFLETKDAVTDKDLGLLASAVAYAGILAFFPALVALVSLYGLLADPAQIVQAGNSLKQYVPAELGDLIIKQLLPLTKNHAAGIVAGIVAAAFALFSAAGGMETLIKSLNRSYDVTESRNFIALRVVSLALVVGLVIIAIPIGALLALKGSFLAAAGLPEPLRILILTGRWVLLAVIITVILAVFYRYAPDRREPRWQIVSAGGIAATVVWMAATALFFLYLHIFAGFSHTYGIFAGLIILMTWLNLSALIVLVGAEVNNRLERRTDRERLL